MKRRPVAIAMFATLAWLPVGVAQTAQQSAAPAAPTNDASPSALSADDPRRCLEFADNLQIIVCAEKHRPHKRRS